MCESPKHADRRIAPAALDAAQVGQVYLGVVGELLLGQLPLDPQPTHIRANDPAPIHPTDWRAAAGDDLGTIVPISLTQAGSAAG